MDQQTRIKNFMPKTKFAEIIKVQDSLGRKVSEDIYAEQEYPLVTLSAIDGEMLNIQEDIKTVEQYKKIIRDKVLGVLQLGENPFEVKTDQDFVVPIAAYMKIGNIANTVITIEQKLPWFNAAFLKPERGDVLVEIKKGQGVIESGSDFRQDDIVLAKDEIITSTKKALLKQAGVNEVIVYKDIRIAVLCVDYDSAELNSQLEFEYIQDCMKSWGYSFDVLRIKPHKDIPVNALDIEINDAGFSTDFKTYSENIQKMAHEYDYIVACGLVENRFFHQKGLLRGTNEFRSCFETGQYNQKLRFFSRRFKFFLGNSRSPDIRENVRYYNKQRLPTLTKMELYEDKAVMSYIPGHILDVIVNMHLLVKPTILQKMNRVPCSPDWKIGKLLHDFSFEIDDDYRNKILWGYVTRIKYDEVRRISTEEIPELKIITVENERPDMLSFMKECNCFIPVMGEDNQLKVGDYLYYLEI
ncbi:molybdopterin-binding domain-containing protein [Acinetobacter wuhouensis]|uniref:MoeA protein n=1 Tax=Acinetobacter wuhouensis TaxID=1879050 RepID=UPI001D18F136|nr:MoeA protein [Acinetobacter wuhouensis]